MFFFFKKKLSFTKLFFLIGTLLNPITSIKQQNEDSTSFNYQKKTVVCFFICLVKK